VWISEDTRRSPFVFEHTHNPLEWWNGRSLPESVVDLFYGPLTLGEQV
jgi:hypothetical protein